MNRKIVFSFLAILLFASLFSYAAAAKPSANKKVLVWSANAAPHVEVVAFTGNATAWGYDVSNTTETINASVLTGIDVLIVNGPGFLLNAELTAITTWFNGAAGRSIWVAGESDYGGYWIANGTATNPGVNHLLYEIGAHIYIQDDAVNDAVSQDGGGYRVIANTTNTIDSPAKTIMKNVHNVSMHGPTAVIAYSSVTAAGVGTVANFNAIENCEWLLNTSVYGSIADQDFDDDTVWEGFPVGINMSLTMAAIEWDLGTSNNKIVLTGESIFADYKNMFDRYTRYVVSELQNIEMTENILDWLTGQLTTAPGFEFIPTFLVLAILPIAYKKRK
jgi:hypothetical protein